MPSGLVALWLACAAELPSNVVRLDHDVWTGPAAVDVTALAEAGVRTLVSVDALPSPPSPAGHVLRRVHLPLAYDGISARQADALLVAWRDCPRPIYIHCHHGRHRGPAAAVTVLRRLGRIDADRGRALLEQCGTSLAYLGLWKAVIDARPVGAELLGRLRGDLLETQPVGSMSQAMATLDRGWERLRISAANGWTAPEDHPDLAPLADAAAVTDHLRQIATLSRDRPEGFKWTLNQLVAGATRLEAALLQGDHQMAHRIRVWMDVGCTSCHSGHRDGGRFVGFPHVAPWGGPEPSSFGDAPLNGEGTDADGTQFVPEAGGGDAAGPLDIPREEGAYASLRLR